MIFFWECGRLRTHLFMNFPYRPYRITLRNLEHISMKLGEILFSTIINWLIVFAHIDFCSPTACHPFFNNNMWPPV